MYKNDQYMHGAGLTDTNSNIFVMRNCKTS